MRLAYFYAVIGIVLSLVIVSSFAQVPLQAQSGQSTLSIGKISLNYLTKNGYESTPAVPEHWALSALPLSWFNSAPTITGAWTSSNASSSTILSPNIYTSEDSAYPYYGNSGGEVIIYDNYIYAFCTSTGTIAGSRSGGTLYWTSEPYSDYDYIVTKATWTESSYSDITYLGAAILVNNTVYIGAQMSGDAYIIAATLGSGGTISSWTTYEIATSGAVEAILYANGKWYVAVGNGPAIVYYGSSLSSLSTYAPSGYTYGDIVGLVQTANGDIVVGWYDGQTDVAFAYYNPSSNAWSSVYTISAPSGYYSSDWGIIAFQNDNYAPTYGYQMAATGNTVVFALIWYDVYPASTTSLIGDSNIITLYSYQIGASSPTLLYEGNIYNEYGYQTWLALYGVENDIYLAYGYTASSGAQYVAVNVSDNAGETWSNIYLSGTSTFENGGMCSYGAGQGAAKFYPMPQYVFYNGSIIVFSLGDYPLSNTVSDYELEFPLMGLMVVNAPQSLSSYQISLSNIVPSGSFVEAYSGAPLNTFNLTATVYQGLSTSNLTQGASQTWTDVSSGSSLSWITPWLQLQNPSTNSNGTYTNYYLIDFTLNSINAITKQPMSYTTNVTLTNSLYWDTSLDVFNGSNFYITGGNMTPVLEIPFQAIILLVLLWSAIGYLIYRDIRMVEPD